MALAKSLSDGVNNVFVTGWESQILAVYTPDSHSVTFSAPQGASDHVVMYPS